MWCQNSRVKYQSVNLAPQGESCPLVKGWGVGCLTMTIPRKSPHACHGEPTLVNGMRFPGQACAASVPHHNQVLQLDLGL